MNYLHSCIMLNKILSYGDFCNTYKCIITAGVVFVCTLHSTTEVKGL